MLADKSNESQVAETSSDVSVVTETEKEEMTLFKACKLGDVELVEMLLKNDSHDIDILIDGWSCLHEASMHRCQFCKITKLLLEHGADVNIQDNSGNTPLHMAVIYHCIENAKLLFDHKADIHLKNKNGASSVDIARSLQDNDVLGVLQQDLVVEKKKKQQKKVIPKENINLPDIYKNHVSSPILKKRKYQDDKDELPKAKRSSVSFKED